VLGVAAIAVKKVIPAMQKGDWSEIAAIASRDSRKAEDAAHQLAIPKAYGSYEELLADPEIETIYNPLPNHLHVPWSIKAAEAGKHVLCEKPLSLTVREAKELLRVRDRCDVKIGEAFMVKTHPQWLRVRDLIAKGVVGKLRSIVGIFSYFNRDPKNVRNVAEWGGGGLMDIGCYPIQISRFLFGEEACRKIITKTFAHCRGLRRLAKTGTNRILNCVTKLVKNNLGIFSIVYSTGAERDASIMGAVPGVIFIRPVRIDLQRLSEDRAGSPETQRF